MRSLICILICSLIWCFPKALVAQDFSLRLTGGAVSAGQTLLVPITVEGFEDMQALEFHFRYDDEKLVYFNAEQFHPNVTNFGAGNVNLSSSHNDEIILSWTDLMGTNTIPDGETLMVLRFVAEEDGFSEVYVDVTKPIEIVTVAGDINDYEFFRGGVNGVRVSGSVLEDLNLNCLPEPGERGISEFILEGSTTNYLAYSTTDDNGAYSFIAPAPSVLDILSTSATDIYTKCQPTETVTIPTYSEVKHDFVVQPNGACPYLEVDISATHLDVCDTVVYYANYKNKGVIPAFNATLTVVIDPYINFLSAIPAPTAVDGQKLTFDIGNVAIDGQGTIRIKGILDCPGTLQGQTYCTKIEATPQPICAPVSPLWSQASLQTTATCIDDSVRMVVTNIGNADMVIASDGIIIEDMILGLEAPININQGDSVIYTLPSEDKTWRISVDQVSDHPGHSRPTAAVEGCGGYNANTSLGEYTAHPEDDANYYISEDCQESVTNIGNYILRGYPKGFGSEHCITRGTDIEYLIYFRNDSPDTIRSVVVTDSLSVFLDALTVRPGASSLDYDFEVTGAGIVTFTFDDMVLPPSIHNSRASEGFVKFRVSQKPNLPTGSVIVNVARVKMDTQGSIYTTIRTHRICGDHESEFLLTDLTPSVQYLSAIQLYPNPVVDGFWLVSDSDLPQGTTIEVVNVVGQVVEKMPYVNNTSYYRWQSLSKGFHALRIVGPKGKLLASGTVVKE